MIHTDAPKTKSLQGILSLHSAAATETYSASLCITIILKCDVEHRDAKISSICCIFICAHIITYIILSSQDSTVSPYHGSSVGLDGPQSDLNHWPSGWKASVITTRLWGHHGILPICMCPECSMPQGTELSIIARANVFWTNTHAGNAECSISQVRESEMYVCIYPQKKKNGHDGIAEGSYHRAI